MKPTRSSSPARRLAHLALAALVALQPALAAAADGARGSADCSESCCCVTPAGEQAATSCCSSDEEPAPAGPSLSADTCGCTAGLPAGGEAPEEIQRANASERDLALGRIARDAQRSARTPVAEPPPVRTIFRCSDPPSLADGAAPPGACAAVRVLVTRGVDAFLSCFGTALL